jgi:riboflavin synthase
MFTGIVEELGHIAAQESHGDVLRLRIAASRVTSDLAIGDSIAVNGTCLTAVRIDHEDQESASRESPPSAFFEVELVPETLRRTSLGAVGIGGAVNLERSVTPTTRMGGHFVQGHVDGLGEVVAREADGEGGSWMLTITAPASVMPYIVPKGFIAIDGTSLTIVDRQSDRFRVALIPHTLEQTIAGNYHPGRPVNLEADILGKYVAQLVADGALAAATLSTTTPSAPIAGEGLS